MPQNTDLGQLILQLDPYIGAPISEPVLKINAIDIYCRNPTPGAAAPAPTIAQIKYELDGPYAQDWNFRGQPQKVGMAVRICVRYEITDPSGGSSWAEDYLLVGYGGGMGG
jgi:hypothetical protein